jgi:hypothetical protein
MSSGLIPDHDNQENMTRLLKDEIKCTTISDADLIDGTEKVVALRTRAGCND